MTDVSWLFGLVSAVIVILLGMILRRADRTAEDVIKLKTAILGMDGYGGLISDVEDHEVRIGKLERSA